MIRWIDTAPEIDVDPAEYQRLLGYPPDAEWSERSLELAAWARRWYADHGRPWIYARETRALAVSNDAITIDHVSFSSRYLRRTLRDAAACGVLLVAVSAGVEVEQHAQELWEQERPDEYFFLEMFGSAVVEHLLTMTGARLCEWADGSGLAVLPHYSPGYSDWDIVEQNRLLAMIASELPAPLEALDSGALRPKKAQIAVFGIAPQSEKLRPLTGLVPCENCALRSCQFRRTPRRRAGQSAPEYAASYTVNPKALKRWAAERLSLEERSHGGIAARFRFEGTTCSNMGRPLVFDYDVELGPREAGYPILEQRCAPATCDTGHACMCKYIENGPALLAEIESEMPLNGQPLAEVLTWKRPVCSTGCYCEPASRLHKWGLVLETIYYALSQRQ